MTQPFSRREVFCALAGAGLGVGAFARSLSALRIGIMDGIVGHASQPESVDAAADLGLAGVQVTLGKPDASGQLALSNPGLQERFREAAKRRGIALPNTYLDILHTDCLKDSSAAALRWIQQGLTITKALGADVLMLVFFGHCAIEKEPEQKAVVAPLREACRMAQDTGIVLGFENTISAKDNLAILQAVDSPALKIWYDIGNSTNIGHFNVPEEIRLLGREHICAFHIKDKSYLDTGAVPVRGALQAIRDINFKGFAMLETTAPTGDHLADARRNFDILRQDIRFVESAR
ncbi:MAG: sugar phosphate isomerase/epimerase [Acidobacteriaceae bacterium]|nr:sugar phosphate isomerase/epimerase [Acidobacteriaceae bacterium]